MALFSSSSSSSSSSDFAIPFRKKYDVFLSFTSEDTRDKFTSRLLALLRHENITTFCVDYDDLEGESLSPLPIFCKEIIGKSTLSVIIFSEKYAFSPLRLAELSHILECSKKTGQILPIFYNVDLSDVQKQQGSYAAAFWKHEGDNKHYNKVHEWRNALRMAANIPGRDTRGRSDNEIVEIIVQDIQRKLNRPFPTDSLKGLLTIEERIEELEKLLRIGSHDIRVIGIWEETGAGKTTLANAVYNRLFFQFEDCYFLANVGEETKKNGLISLNRKLLAELFNEKDPRLRGLSSRSTPVIEKHQSRRVLLVLDDVDDQNQFQQLVREHYSRFSAGSRIIVTTRFPQLLNNVRVDLAEVYHLRDRFNWNAFENDDIQTKELVTCYGGLDEREKEIFLDVACFFQSRRDAEKIIDDLIAKSLITINHDKQLWMDDMVRQLGWKIISQRSRQLGNCSRLSLDSHFLLKNYLGAVRVEGIFLDTSQIFCREFELHPIVFQNMNELRLLKIQHGDPNNTYIRKHKINLPKGLHSLPSTLAYLHWDEYPLQSLPPNFSPKNLVILIIRNSHIEQLWTGIKIAPKLEVLDLSYSKKLSEIPDFFYQAPYIESINLQFCTSLSQVPSTFQQLNSLKILNLRGCSCIQEFPSILPKNIRSLDLSCTLIQEVPSSIQYLRYLETLDLENCKGLVTLTDSIHSLKYLKCINLFASSKLKKFPEIKERMESLKDLNLDGTAIPGLPWSIGNLIGLERLSLKMCESLEFLPESISELNSLKELSICCCQKLKRLPKLPLYLENLSAENCTSLRTVWSNIARIEEWNHSFPYRNGRFNFMNCLRLPESAKTDLTNEARVRMLHMATLSSKEKEGRMFVTWCPGDKIPEWFKGGSKGPSMQIKLPPNCYSSNFLGFAIGVVVDFNKFYIEDNFTFHFHFGLTMDSQPHEVVNDTLIFNMGNDPSGSDHHITVDSEHLFLFNYCNKKIFTTKYDNNSTAASFKFYSKKSGCKVKSCGVHLLYANDVNETKFQGITQDVVTNFKNVSLGQEPEASGSHNAHDACTKKKEDMKKRFHDTQDAGESSTSSSSSSSLSSSSKIEKDEEEENGFPNYNPESSRSVDVRQVAHTKMEEEENLNPKLKSPKEDQSANSCSCLTFLGPVVDHFRRILGRQSRHDKDPVHEERRQAMMDLGEHNKRNSQHLQTVTKKIANGYFDSPETTAASVVAPSQSRPDKDPVYEERQQAPDTVLQRIMVDLGEHNKRISRHFQTVMPKRSNGSVDSPETTSASVVAPSQSTSVEKELQETAEEIIDSLCSQIIELRDQNSLILQNLQTLVLTKPDDQIVEIFPVSTSSLSGSNFNDLSEDVIADEQWVEVPEEVIHFLRSHLTELRGHNQQMLQFLHMAMCNSPPTSARR